jgi:hypothetical protein
MKMQGLKETTVYKDQESAYSEIHLQPLANPICQYPAEKHEPLSLKDILNKMGYLNPPLSDKTQN